jgi:biotin synthase
MTYNLQDWVDNAIVNKPFPETFASAILAPDKIGILPLIDAAGKVRMDKFGKKVKLHQINNIQNGLCPEDCGYCGQSKTASQPTKQYIIKNEDAIIEDARQAKERGVYRYCMVASGRGPNDRQMDQLKRIVGRVHDEVGIRSCLSVGFINDQQARDLKSCGLDRLNHNLNTSEAHTSKVVSTHTFQDRIDTLRAASNAGLGSCSGMIAGMGETDEDILEVAYKLRDMKVPSIPINFLVPIEGNRIKDFDQLTPERCLRILCLFRFVNPRVEIRVGGGREGHLRGMQGLALYPANSLFIEGYLVTRGDDFDKVERMISDAGFEIDGVAQKKPTCAKGHTFKIDDNPNIMNPDTVEISD